MSTQPLRVVLIGAGAIAEFHARAVARVPDAQIVAIVDERVERARALGARHGVARAGADLDEIWPAGVDVVHVLTPPATHAAVTLGALGRGCHVYVEKPLATSAEDCDRIAEAARAAGRTVGVGHSLLRDPSVVKAFDLVRSGAIGDVISVEYVRSQPAPTYSGGVLPEYFRDGGFPFRDAGVHGVYLLEALLGTIGGVQVQVNSSARHPLVYCDEWHVLADCARGTGRLHLSWTAQPWQSLLTIAGTRGTIRADLFAATVTSRVARPLPGPAVRLVNTTLEAVALLRQSARSVAAVGLGRLRQYHGVQQLVEEFYRDLASGRPPAVTPGQARSAVVWTEHIARQGDERKRLFTDRCAIGPTADVLVTGATGFVGRRLVTKLLQEGRRVRVLVRREPPSEWGNDPRIEVLYGDLGDPEAVDRAVAGTNLVFHLGAAMRGDAAEFDRSTIAGTRHVVESILRAPAARLVYMSSLAVLHSAAARDAVTIDESWPLEPRPSARGHYTRTKLAAERIVTEAASERGLQAVVLRPSEIVGPGAPLLTSGVAQQLGRTLIVLGDGTLQVPMVALDDVIDALWRAGTNGPFNGVVLHVVDPEPVTQNDVIHRYTRAAGGAWRVVRVPRAIVTASAGAAELIFALARRSAPLSRYRIASALAPRRFGGARAEAVLGWSPKVGVPGALAAMASAVEQRASADTQR